MILRPLCSSKTVAMVFKDLPFRELSQSASSPVGKKMQIIGLTGGIATGKSSAVTYLQSQGIAVVDADLFAHQAIAPNTAGCRQVCASFPEAVLRGGLLDRVRLGEIIFSDAKRRRQLERIVHPRVRWAMLKTILRYWLIGRDRVVLDIPLLFETGLHRWMSYTVVIKASHGHQINRLEKRNGLDRESAERRIAAQMPIERKAALADVVIDNEGDLLSLYQQLQLKVVARRPSYLIHRILCHLAPLSLTILLAIVAILRIISYTAGHTRLYP